jgi:arginine decarboxylase-like protein
VSKQPSWTIKHAEDYYGFKRWGGNNFSVDTQGNLCVHPKGDHRKIRIADIVKEAEASGLKPPLTIRVQDLLRQRVPKSTKLFVARSKKKITTHVIAEFSRLK